MHFFAALLFAASLSNEPIYRDVHGRDTGTHKAPIIYQTPRETTPSRREDKGKKHEEPIRAHFASSGTLKVLLEWRYWVEGVGIGDRGIEIVDVDGDGVGEIIASTGPEGFLSNNRWQIYRRQADGEFVHMWHSDVYPAGISNLRALDTNGDGVREICVSTGSSIHVIDPKTYARMYTIETSSNNIRGLSCADVDSDGQLEFVFCDADALYIYNVASGLLEHRLAGYGGLDLAVGNTDTDSHLEIVIGNDPSPGRVIDGSTRAVKWTYQPGFGSLIRLADFDFDGMAEIVGASNWYLDITTFDADIQSLVWQANLSKSIDAIKIADVDHDGTLEVIHGDTQFGEVHVRDARTGGQEWEIDNPKHGVTDIAIGNIDLDGANEVVFGAGFSSSASDNLFVFDGDSHNIEWMSTDISGPFTALDYGDLDNDGLNELAIGAYKSDSGYGSGKLLLFDAKTKILKYRNATPGSSDRLKRLCVGGMDDDPQLEICLGLGDPYDGVVYSIDGITRAVQYGTPALYGQTIDGLVIANVDADVDMEIVATTGRGHTGATGTYIFVFNAATGALEWQSPIPLGYAWGGLGMLRIANVDDDANLEIVVAETGSALWIFDGVTHEMQLATADLDITALDTRDLDGDGILEVITGSLSGAIVVRNPATGAVTQTLGNFGARIDGLRVRNVAGTAEADLIFVVNGILKIAYKEGGSSRTWSAVSAIPGSGMNDSIVVADVDQDGQFEIMVGDGKYGVSVYQVSSIRRSGQ